MHFALIAVEAHVTPDPSVPGVLRTCRSTCFAVGVSAGCLTSNRSLRLLWVTTSANGVQLHNPMSVLSPSPLEGICSDVAEMLPNCPCGCTEPKPDARRDRLYQVHTVPAHGARPPRMWVSRVPPRHMPDRASIPRNACCPRPPRSSPEYVCALTCVRARVSLTALSAPTPVPPDRFRRTIAPLIGVGV